MISLLHVMTQQKGCCLQAKKLALARAQPRWQPDLKLPGLRNCEKSISVVQAGWYFAMAAQADEDIPPPNCGHNN